MKLTAVRYKKENRIVTITLARPEKKNALNDEMIAQLRKAFRSAEKDKDVKVIVLTAEGDVFSAGADLEYLQRLQEYSFKQNLRDSNQFRKLLTRIYCANKIVIAQVEGHAIAGGCGLVAACDFSFSVPEAKFGFTEVKIGFIPALVSVILETKLRGADVRRLLLTGNLIDAKSANNMGLITEVIAKKSIAEHVQNFASQICEGTSSNSIAMTKELLGKISSSPLKASMSLAAEMNAQARMSDDYRKGIASFLNKEKITW